MEKLLDKRLCEEYNELVEDIEQGLASIEEMDRFYDRHGTIDEMGIRILTFEMEGK